MASMWSLVIGLVAARSCRLKGVKDVWVEETGMLSMLTGELYQGSGSDCCFWSWGTCMHQLRAFGLGSGRRSCREDVMLLAPIWV